MPFVASNFSEPSPYLRVDTRRLSAATPKVDSRRPTSRNRENCIVFAKQLHPEWLSTVSRKLALLLRRSARFLAPFLEMFHALRNKEKNEERMTVGEGREEKE